MENKIKGGSTNKVNITKESGEVVEYHKKEDMERLIADSNNKKWHWPEGRIWTNSSLTFNAGFIPQLG